MGVGIGRVRQVGRVGALRARRRLRLLTPLLGVALAFAAVPVANGGGSAAAAVTASATTADGVVVDGWGGLHPFGYGGGTSIQSFKRAPYFPGFDIVRGVALRATNTATCASFGGYTLDGFGGLHPFGINGAGAPAHLADGPYWKGWDIARDVALVPQDPRQVDSPPIGGLVLDGFGGLHWFTIQAGAHSPVLSRLPYWKGFDIARGVIILTSAAVSGGYLGGFIVDAWGGLHGFGINGHTPPPVRSEPYWKPWAIAQGGAGIPGLNTATGGGGLELDGWGGLHSFTFGTGAAPNTSLLHGVPSWKGFDIARGVAMKPRKAGC